MTHTRADARLTLTVGVFVVLGLIQAVWPLSMDLYLPAFPAMAVDLSVPAQTVQATLTAAFIGMAIGQLATGPWSDRVGRLRPMVTALVVYSAGSVACAVAATAPVLVGARFVQGLGAAGASVITIAIVRDAAEGSAMVRALARLQMVNGIFVVLAPSMGAYLLIVMPWRGLFWVLAAAGVVLIVLTLAVLARRLPPVPTGQERPRVALYGPLARDPRYLLLAAASGMLFASMMAYMASSAFIFQGTFGLTEASYAVIFGGHGLLMIAGAQTSAALSSRLAPMRVATVGVGVLIVAAGATIVLGVATGQSQLWAFVAPLLVFTTAFGFVGPALATSVLRDHRDRAGAAASIEGAARMVFGAVAAPVAGALGATSSVAIGSVMLVLVLAAAGLVTAASARDRRTLRDARVSASSAA
ncbi:MFS transporter [Demequina globuliformis]|uniref:MFS transporter n=1 Tax=Demequina globuliformis TaxID=676202 RepID=UPI0007864F3B|nr:MFS transporter [Demequina globuliformis]